jgi:hypothetical protein
MANTLPTEKWPLRESADLVECWTSSTTANLLGRNRILLDLVSQRATRLRTLPGTGESMP